MKHDCVLLLDFANTATLSNDLIEILQSAMGKQWSLHHERIDGLAEVDSAKSSNSKLQKIKSLIAHYDPDVLCLALPRVALEHSMPAVQALCKSLRERPLILIVDTVEPDDLSALFESGAADFITPPLKAVDILPRIKRLIEQYRQSETIVQRLKKKLGLKQLIGESQSFRAVTEKLPSVARCDATVLISGETGTGKEMFARAIHHLSPRAHHPFIPINCGAIPTELIENELFGHERGAFTDAAVISHGLIYEADGGTLFLDEIDSLPSQAQVKLLRFLQEKEYRSLGSTKTQRADVRVIAASNLNLEEAVQFGKLRRDLYYRLNVIPLHLPPLRERREDIPLLASHFLAKYAAAFGKPSISLSPEAMQKLKLHDWLGNVRELEHIIERAIALTDHPQIQTADFLLPGETPCGCQESLKTAKARCVADFERTYIQELLLTHQGNISKAAKAAQKNRRAFWQLIQKYGIDVQKFRATDLNK